MAVNSSITELILAYEAEKNGYGDAQTQISSQGMDVFVISDLHLSTGKGLDGKYYGTENFFYDSAFSRFLNFLQNELKEKKGILVINGDFIDFLRIIITPQTDNEFDEWHSVLSDAGISKPVEALKSSISKRERKFGLKTNDFKSVWRLHKAMQGHPEFFNALAGWLISGHTLAIIKGNHDLEWIWPGVRNYFRLRMAERIVTQTELNLEDALSTLVFPNVIFADNSLLMDEEIYLEHGHRFDKLCHVVEPKLPENTQELNIPFGSFFNRYFLNQIELKYPYFDNVRPRENILPLLFRKNFLSGLKVLFVQIPLMLKSIPINYYKFIFNPFIIYLLPFIVLVVWLLLSGIFSFIVNENSLALISYLMLSPEKFLIWAIFTFFYLYIISGSHLKEPDSLDVYAKELFRNNVKCRFIIFGHTHNPDQAEFDGKWFYNCGTWIPVIEASNADIREDRTYTYVHLCRDKQGKYSPNNLQRWNDDAGRPDAQILIHRK